MTMYLHQGQVLFTARTNAHICFALIVVVVTVVVLVVESHRNGNTQPGVIPNSHVFAQ
jgi:hypothetical protein